MLYIGFEVNFSFIKHEAFRGLSMQQLDLYKYMFAPDLQPQTLAIIGCIGPVGPVQPVLEMQCRFAARVLKVWLYKCCIYRKIVHAFYPIWYKPTI